MRKKEKIRRETRVPKRILVVDDDPDLVSVLEARLKTNGYEVRGVSDAVMVVEVARAFNPDLIMLDLMLPGGDGLVVLKRLWMIPSVKNIPVVVLTGVRDEGYKKKILEAGVSAYVEKPYDVEDLLSKIRGILGESIV